jgi:serine phosphatase RsbU (regulator of sigma subunit)
LSLLEEKKKRTEDSLQFAITLREDSINKIETAKKAADLEIENQKQQILLQEQANELMKINSQRQKMFLYSGAVGIMLLLLLILGGFAALQQKRKANQELEIKNLQITKAKDEIETKSFELKDAMSHIQFQNKNILQSINYAQRIQDAMLPKQLGMKSLFPDSFIFFKPRDVVSGDFYWFEDIYKKLNGSKNPQLEKASELRKIFIAAVDCTGHGVPGAFMSMLGFNLLNDIVRRGIFESDKILNNLHHGIRKSLNQEETQNRDGMDMSLCVIDPVNKIMEYSGAQNPLLYIQDGKMFRIRANKFPVGGFQVEDHNFTKHVISLDKPITCYLFSDGFTDQFGGPNGRKFMAKNFRDLLYEIYEMPMDEQKKILELVMNEWMGVNEQTDDVLIIGFKIDLEGNKIED